LAQNLKQKHIAEKRIREAEEEREEKVAEAKLRWDEGHKTLADSKHKLTAAIDEVS